VISGDDDQGIAVGFGEGQGHLYGFVEVDGFADLAAGVSGVVLFVDGGTFYLQEETVAVVFKK